MDDRGLPPFSTLLPPFSTLLPPLTLTLTDEIGNRRVGLTLYLLLLYIKKIILSKRG